MNENQHAEMNASSVRARARSYRVAMLEIHKFLEGQINENSAAVRVLTFMQEMNNVTRLRLHWENSFGQANAV